MSIADDFLALSVRASALKFGEFKLKSERMSPYFFNAGLFNTGGLLGALTDLYAQTFLREPRMAADVLFGPAYKGITLASGMAMALARHGVDLPYAYNRKEAKDHGEGGALVGASIAGKRVLIVDDVITAGTAIRESVDIITQAGGTPCGVLLALDRQERGKVGDMSAVQEVERQFGLPVRAVATLDDLMGFVGQSDTFREYLPAVQAYRATYGVKPSI